jgi:hypothetical protein
MLNIMIVTMGDEGAYKKWFRFLIVSPVCYKRLQTSVQLTLCP